MYRLGLDIGGTKIGIGIVDGEGRLLGKSRLSVECVTDVFAEIKKAVAALAASIGIPTKNILSCGVGIPGTVSEDGRRVLLAPNIAILSENFADDLEKALGIPVRMVQDSRAAALGEYLAGAGKGKKALVCVTLGTGIGTGIVVDGKLYHGALGCAGEHHDGIERVVTMNKAFHQFPLHMAFLPPSIMIFSPVIKAPFSEAR